MRREGRVKLLRDHLINEISWINPYQWYQWRDQHKRANTSGLPGLSNEPSAPRHRSFLSASTAKHSHSTYLLHALQTTVLGVTKYACARLSVYAQRVHRTYLRRTPGSLNLMPLLPDTSRNFYPTARFLPNVLRET